MIERERSLEESDGLRYYMDGTVTPLWEEWFHCVDLGTQLGPVIKKCSRQANSFVVVSMIVALCHSFFPVRYFSSEEHRTGKPPEGEVLKNEISRDPTPPTPPHR